MIKPKELDIEMPKFTLGFYIGSMLIVWFASGVWRDLGTTSRRMDTKTGRNEITIETLNERIINLEVAKIEDDTRLKVEKEYKVGRYEK